MTPRTLGRTGIQLSPIGFGAFKIGRNEGIKYPHGYELPSDAEAARLLAGVLDLGISWIDTAPAYGVSEARIGAILAPRRAEFVLSTKVGESFSDGVSRYDYSAEATRTSLERSARLLRTNRFDLVFVHSDGRDESALASGDVTAELRAARERGMVRALGFSAKSVAGAVAAMDAGYEALMLELHPLDESMRPVIGEAAARGVGVVIKKPLASGLVPAAEAIPFALAIPGVTSLALGGLRLERFADAVALANAVCAP